MDSGCNDTRNAVAKTLNGRVEMIVQSERRH